MKSKSSAKKRFTATGSGKVKRSVANRRHLLESKTPKASRQHRHSTYIADSDMKAVRAMLPYI